MLASHQSRAMPPTELTLDRTDKRILEHLQHNARASNLELAEAVGCRGQWAAARGGLQGW